MVIINDKKCTGCGICSALCHESCMTLKNKKININHDICSTCAQCIAVCPERALAWDNHEPDPFNNNLLPSSEQIDELFKQRRTVRQFKKSKPERHVIEEIINYGMYAPTHAHSFRVIAVESDVKLHEIDKILFSFIRMIHRFLFKPLIVRLLLKVLPSSFRDEFHKARPKIEKSLKQGRAYSCMPPVILFIVGDKNVQLSLESAQYVMYNMDLYARTKGLGCRNLVGNQMFFSRSRKMRNLLGINKDENIFATMGIGYSATKFVNKVQGKTMQVRWI